MIAKHNKGIILHIVDVKCFWMSRNGLEVISLILNGIIVSSTVKTLFRKDCSFSFCRSCPIVKEKPVLRNIHGKTTTQIRQDNKCKLPVLFVDGIGLGCRSRCLFQWIRRCANERGDKARETTRGIPQHDDNRCNWRRFHTIIQ